MAKIKLKADAKIEAVAKELANAGITVDTRPLGDNYYRAYVRKENMGRFLSFFNEIESAGLKTREHNEEKKGEI